MFRMKHIKFILAKSWMMKKIGLNHPNHRPLLPSLRALPLSEPTALNCDAVRLPDAVRFVSFTVAHFMAWFVPTPASINTKERQVRRPKKRKGIEAQRPKPSTPFQATDAQIGDEQQNGKQKKNKREKQKAGPQPDYPGPFGRPFRPSWIILWN